MDPGALGVHDLATLGMSLPVSIRHVRYCTGACHASHCNVCSTICEAWPQKTGEMFSTFVAEEFLTKHSCELFSFLKEMVICEHCLYNYVNNSCQTKDYLESELRGWADGSKKLSRKQIFKIVHFTDDPLVLKKKD